MEITINNIEFGNEKEFPSDLNKGQSRFSIDVLIYCEDEDVYSVGWYDFIDHKWHFLCNEQSIEKFTWRNFIDGIDNNKPLNLNNETSSKRIRKKTQNTRV